MIEPRIFVGTLACGEAEQQRSRDAIAAQANVSVEHLVIESLPEPEAHANLFQAWNERRELADLFVKIDADTVLNANDCLARVWARFSADPDVTGMQIGLHDYFTNGVISGMNAFSSAVRFEGQGGSLFCDRVDEIGHRRVLKAQDVPDLTPIAWHCLDPHPRQAFHFGYRRALKRQKRILADVVAAYQRLKGQGRAFALLGAAQAYETPVDDTSYASDAFEALFLKVEAADAREIEAAVRRVHRATAERRSIGARLSALFSVARP